MKHLDKVNAILFIRPGAQFRLSGDELEWLDAEQTQPNEEEIEIGLINYLEKIENEKIEAEAKKATAEAKLAALGLTPDDLKALGL
jgi:predicted P-loop ATPase